MTFSKSCDGRANRRTLHACSGCMSVRARMRDDVVVFVRDLVLVRGDRTQNTSSRSLADARECDADCSNYTLPSTSIISNQLTATPVQPTHVARERMFDRKETRSEDGVRCA